MTISSKFSSCFHVITGLNDGGAEGALFRLCFKDSNHQHVIISLAGDGKYGPLLRDKGIRVYALGMRSGSPSLFAFIKLTYLLFKYKPNVVQTWMYHADLLGGLAARLLGIRSVVWGIRHTTLEADKSKRTTIWIAKLLAKLSWWLPSRIVVCAQSAKQVHESLGYNGAIMRYIPNGYDLANFAPMPIAAAELRTSWGLDSSTPLLGTVGRYNPQKDHANLLLALAELMQRGIRLRCVLVGTGVDESNAQLCRQIEALGLKDVVLLLGPRSDIPVVMSAIDIHVLPSSFGEAFPNVVAEAMACETPCVVTHVGDAASIVGETGWVVPPSNALALANTIEQALLALKSPADWQQRKTAARHRIVQNFSLERMVAEYHAVWDEAR